MPLLYILPLISLLAYIICLLLTLINYKEKKKGFLFLFLFILSTNVIFSLIEVVVIYHYKGLSDLIIKKNLGVFLLLIIANLLTYFIKEYFILKGLKDEKPNFEKITSKLNLIDPINLIMVIVTVLLFK